MECYSKILNMTPNEKDSGRIHWNQFLSQKEDQNKLRNSMINSMIQAGNEHNQKVQPPTSLEDILDKTDKERVLLVLKESLGDHYLLTRLLPEIKLKYPEASIYIGCDPKYNEIYELNEYVLPII